MYLVDLRSVSGQTDSNYDELSQDRVSRPRFEMGASKTQVRNSYVWFITFSTSHEIPIT